jgi:Spy/CpxP family protein refolding chaperone
MRGISPARHAPPRAKRLGRRKKIEMHPGFIGWLRQRHAEYHSAGGHEAHPGEAWGHGSCHGRRGGWHHTSHGFEEGGGGFGVRRPLRFLAHKLGLNDDQVGQFAAILDRLKTERAQADVDSRRRTASLAEAFESASFDHVKVDAANAEQAASAERLRISVKRALEGMHALLDVEQRKKFAYLLRAGILAI